MNLAKVHQTIDPYLIQLTPEHLNIAVQFLAYLAEKESEDATKELTDIPGFIESFERGRNDIARGLVTPYKQLKRKQ
ncbi:MAG: hypothetical protein R2941_24915 [Desulfobacterales bacterium]